MKIFSNHILYAASLFFLIAACSSPKEKNDIGEPNNSILEAGLLKSGESYSMKIDSIGDIDWFAVPVSGQGYLDVSARNIPDNLNFVVRFANKEEWKSQKENWISGELGLPATIIVSKPDTIYFAFKDKYNKNFSEEEIVFKAEFIEEFDEHEPNNEADGATSVSTGEIVKSIFYPTTDVDWFKTQVDSSGYLMVQARQVPENINVEVRFAKKADEFGKVEYISGGMGLPASIQVNTPGDYYIQLKDKYNKEMSRDMAEWKVDFIKEMDKTEPNNNFKEAYNLTINDTVQIAIFPQGDKDYFTFTPKANSTLRIAVGFPADFRAEFQLYEEVDFEQKPIDKWKTLPAKIEVKANQKYYIQLQTKYDKAFSPEPSKFSVSRIDGRPGEKEDTEQ
ncbi:hypothetical protein EI546_07205 [Aequorivita sp. H23M31]|uniref:Uncharacterized protein n=1 Tax=Aequorivita ciconiae TaxID=2494375 RepID=A0A410G2L1_9FLAO|nr:hypothetical protein [Aequorivita sp. H23M31]QAA81524.1 hypothetical protein EI546_07205 [Aequorivita sp. H23M31]